MVGINRKYNNVLAGMSRGVVCSFDGDCCCKEMIRNDQKEALATPKSAKRTPIRLASHTRRFGGLNSPSDGSPNLELSNSRPTSANNVRVNDDEEEKRQRRQNNMINKATVLSPGCHTPRSAHTSRYSVVHVWWSCLQICMLVTTSFELEHVNEVVDL